MPGVRRSRLEVQVGRRLQEQRARIGAAIEAMRDRRGWTRIELARRAGLGRMVVSRVERGIGNPDLDALQRLAVALDRPLVVSFGGADRAETPADAGHLAIQELILALGRDAGYSGSFELAMRPTEPWRSAEVGLAAPAQRRQLHVECWNTIGDVGAAARSSSRKLADLEDLATARWGDGATVGLVWVVRSTARNRALVARSPEVFASRFPGSSQRWVAAPMTGAPPPDEPVRLVRCRGGQDLRLASTEPRRRHRTRLRRLAAPPALPDTPRPPATPDGRATLPAFTAMTAEE